jgi:hypothetical protein
VTDAQANVLAGLREIGPDIRTSRLARFDMRTWRS